MAPPRDVEILMTDVGWYGAKVIEARIQELQSHIEQQFTGSRKQGYRIHSVFIHRGKHALGRLYRPCR